MGSTRTSARWIRSSEAQRALRAVRPAAAVLLAAVAVGACGGTRSQPRSSDVRPAGKSGKVQPADGRAGSRAGATTIATLGDSIVAGSPRWDPDPGTRARLEQVDERSQWQRWASPASGARFRNCGVWGERTDEIAERFDRCVAGDEVSAVVLQGGINDIVQGRPVEDAAAELDRLACRAAAAGLQVAIADVLPWNNGDEDDARSIARLNRLIADIARRHDVPVLPFFATLDDPQHPGRMPERLTVEGNHPNVRGYRMLGERAWREPRTPTGEDCSAP